MADASTGNPPPGRGLTLPCPAKVNLVLAVGPPRPDGLHDVATWMVALDFADTLTLTPLDDASSRLGVRFADDAPAPRSVDWPREKDLAWRAGEAVQARVGRPLPVAIELVKRVPTGSGLGGGSSDAAAVLVGMDRLFGLSLGREGLLGLAATLGSDVAFLVDAVLGCASAVAGGTGDVLEPAPLGEPIHLALVLPSFGCPTGAVYAAFDRLRPDAPTVRLEPVRAIAERWPASRDELFNDLADPASAAEPRLGALLAAVRDATGETPRVTGSGSASFVVAPSRDAAETLATRVREAVGAPAIAATTLTA